MSSITIFPETSNEYRRLSTAAAKITEATGQTAVVKNVLFDASQNWSWTTIVMEPNDNSMSYQLLCPRDHEIIVLGTEAEVEKCIESLIMQINKKRH